MLTQPTTTPTVETAPALAHVLCPRCFPRPALGDTLTGLCGTEKTYLGDMPVSSVTCVVCVDLVSRRVLPCGHPGEGH